MANELVTGGNGAGKTCYAIVMRMLPTVGKELEYLDQYDIPRKAIRRVCAAGFRNLTVEHERLPHPLTGEVVEKVDIDRWNALDHNDQPVMERLPGTPAVLSEMVNGKMRPLECCLFNWWLWCQPGDMLMIDELQYVYPRGTMGRSPPLWIRKFEIHRHYGVDNLWITPNPQLIDLNLRNQVTDHYHVRAVRFWPRLSMVYFWDHAANVERLTQAIKSKFVKKSEYFKLYKSTVAVTKQPPQGRKNLLLAVPMFGLAIAAGWYALHKSGGAPAAPIASIGRLSSPVPGVKQPGIATAMPVGWTDVPKLSGCYTVGPKCSCTGTDGRPVVIAVEMCRTSARSFDGLVRWEPRPPLPARPLAPGGAASSTLALL